MYFLNKQSCITEMFFIISIVIIDYLSKCLSFYTYLFLLGPQIYIYIYIYIYLFIFIYKYKGYKAELHDQILL